MAFNLVLDSLSREASYCSTLLKKQGLIIGMHPMAASCTYLDTLALKFWVLGHCWNIEPDYTTHVSRLSCIPIE